MKKNWRLHSRTSIVILLMAAILCATPIRSQTSYHLTNKIMIGGEGGWDYLTYEPGMHRLFVSHSDRVVVVDAAGDSIIGEIPGTEGVHGIALDPVTGRGFISCGRSSTVVVFDLKSLKVVADIPVGKRPDAILYDPFSRQIFVFNAGSEDVSAIDPAEDKVRATIPLGGAPEFGVSDSKGHVYVNIENTSEVASIDVRTFKVASRWSIAPGEEPSGLAIDTVHARLFSVCRNKLMIVSDADNRKVVASLPIGSGVDGCVYDQQLQYAFASNGDGTLTIVHEESPVKFVVVETDSTQRGARTIALDPETHTLYLPTAEFEPSPAQGTANPRQRPAIKPHSFVVLEFRR